jgi:hypothetical protein
MVIYSLNTAEVHFAVETTPLCNITVLLLSFLLTAKSINCMIMLRFKQLSTLKLVEKSDNFARRKSQVSQGKKNLHIYL